MLPLPAVGPELATAMLLQYGYTRYLAAKKTVDDRALNQGVVAHVRRALSAREGALRVLDVGAGLGTMLARLVEWQILRKGTYVLLDSDAQTLFDARGWLENWAVEGQKALVSDGATLFIRDPGAGIDLRVEMIEAELGSFLATRSTFPKVDLLVANAFLDLVDASATLPALLELLAPGGTYWFSINFDGETIFEPAHPDDSALLGVYHRSMDVRSRAGIRAGDSKSGRHLFSNLRRAGARIEAVGSSDWVVHAQGGHYPDNEAYFLHHIIHTVDEELRRWPEVEPQRLSDWVALRHSQIDTGELVYIAHQLDFAGRRGETP